MSSDMRASQSVATTRAAVGVEAAEHERQFREILEFCPAADALRHALGLLEKGGQG